MSEKLRRRFILVAALCVFVVLTLFLVCINAWSFHNVTENADRTLRMISENNGIFPKTHKTRPENIEQLLQYDQNIQEMPAGAYKPPKQPAEDGTLSLRRPDASPEAPFFTRYFSVTLDENGAVLNRNTQDIAAVSDEAAEEMAATVLSQGKKKGFYSIYRYEITPLPEGVLVVFLDCTRDLYTLNSFMQNSLYVGAAGFLAVCLLIVIFSKAAVRPVAESYEKQKSFITNAGHELKTPISIIDANCEVIEMENGESQWTQSIHNQVERLTRLTAQLTTLAKMEETQTKLPMERLSLSQIVTDVCDEIEAYAQAQGKTVVAEVVPSCYVQGDDDQLRQLLYILLDNAIKHSLPESEIRLTLSSAGKLTVRNKASLERTGNMNILLERFYRTDQSRSTQTGGYGLGLSIAKAIVDQHKGRITIHAIAQDTLEIAVVLRQG